MEAKRINLTDNALLYYPMESSPLSSHSTPSSISYDEASTQLYSQALLAELALRNHHNRQAIQQYLRQARHSQARQGRKRAANASGMTGQLQPHKQSLDLIRNTPTPINVDVLSPHHQTTPHTTAHRSPLRPRPGQQSGKEGRVSSEVVAPTLNLRPNRANKLKSLLFRDSTAQLEEAVLARDGPPTPQKAPKRSSAHKCEIRFIMEEKMPRNSSSLLSVGADKLALRPKPLRVATEGSDKPVLAEPGVGSPGLQKRGRPLPAISSSQLERNRRCLDIFTRINRAKHREREGIFRMLRGDTFNKLQVERRSTDLAHALLQNQAKRP